MKEVTLKFREVAVDGLPEQSMDCAVVLDYETGAQPGGLPYSSKHGTFNSHDWDSVESVSKYAIGNVTYWLPLHEFFVAIKGEQNENLD